MATLLRAMAIGLVLGTLMGTLLFAEKTRELQVAIELVSGPDE